MLFKIPYDFIREGSEIYPSKVERQVYTRTYSYDGTSTILINDERALEFSVSSDDILEVVIVLRVWEVKG